MLVLYQIDVLYRQTRIPGLTITCDSKVGEHYLSLEQLGIMLRNLPGIH